MMSAHTSIVIRPSASRSPLAIASFSLCTYFFLLLSSTPSAQPLSLGTETAAAAAAAAQDWFPCQINQVVEDFFEEEAGFTYYLCVDTETQSALVLPVDHQVQNEFPANTLVSIKTTKSDVPPPSGTEVSVIKTGSTRSLHSSAEQTTILSDTSVVVSAPLGQRERRQAEVVEEVAGLRSVLLLRVEYNGYTPDYCDEACATAAIAEVDDVYREMSGNKVRFLPSMAQVKTITITNGKYGASGCNYWNIAQEVDAAAVASGVKPTDFQHTVYYLPREFEQSKCTFGGLAFLGCTFPTCKVWLRNEFPATLAHELGHNVNAKHSASDTDNNGVMDSEYGDNSDLMGFQKYWRGMNAPHLVSLGWMAQSATKTIEFCTAQTAETFTLSALGGVATLGETQVAVFPRSAERNTEVSLGAGKYYLSYRAPHGVDALFESTIAKRKQYADKVFLHYTIDSLGMRQNTQLVKVMDAGDSYVDEASKVTITVVRISKATSKADIHITSCTGMTTSTESTTTATTTTTEEPSTTATTTATSTATSTVTTSTETTTTVTTSTETTTTVTTTTVPNAIIQQPSCLNLSPYKAPPKCGKSHKDDLGCCADSGLACKGRKNKKTGEKVFRCQVAQPKKILGATCTKKAHCPGLKKERFCNKDTFVCEVKPPRTKKTTTVAPEEEEEEDEEDVVLVNTDTVNRSRRVEAKHVDVSSNGMVMTLIALVCIAAVVVGVAVVRTQNTEQATIDISAGRFLAQSPEPLAPLTTIVMVV